ncbi:hypothetical protein EJO50_09695 [Iodobacter ciconiae]|uniref:Uncharacterized protein n=1 Tax=Iodobacter ciconiae TaxID=2496266 RepID=A0A3S8ZTE7_9NEIS|nr:hypothetical protein EJO50_09695 [Iodobacter ciconiae]
MLNIAFRLLLTFNATSLLLIVFLVQKSFALGYFFPSYSGLTRLPNIASYLIYLSVPIIFTGLSLRLSSYLGKDEFKKEDIESIGHANNSFLPSYLGYFFVALSVGNWETLWFVYVVLFVFTFLSQALYFSKQKYRKPGEVNIPMAKRINNYTFLERD